MPRQPNVVFVLTDDQGYPPLGCHGHPFIQTPHLDRLHGESARFTQFHTGTTCAPTRAGLMTGHFCNSTGVWHTIGGRSLLRRDEWSLADALRGGGYRTGMFGKWHLGDDYPFRPQDRGFDTVVCHGGGGISQQADWWGNDYFDDTYTMNGQPQSFTGYCTDVFFDQGMAFIRDCAGRDAPFFCYLSTNAPHGPFNVEKRYRDLYQNDTESEQYARFLGMITNIDDNVGRLRALLQELAIEDDTIIVFMSDNGQTGVGDPAAAVYNGEMRGLKGSPYDGGHRVPMFLRWANGGFDRPQTIETLTSYVDFMPTVLDLCGIEVPSRRTFHGDSLVPLLRGETAPKWQQRIIATDTQRVALPLKWRLSCVMQDSWRLVNRDELYDIRRDPGQQQNLAADHPEVLQRLREGYETWWSLCADQIDQEVPLSIGAAEQTCTVLRTHDQRNDLDHGVVWNQGQVRRGEACHGWWEIDVEQSGTYEFDLRRWPVEAGHRVTAGIDGDDIVFDRENIAPGAESMYTGGVAVPCDTAVLRVSGLPARTVDVTDDDVGARVVVDLPAGRRQVRAQFSDAGGHYCSAYYVYVRLLPS